MTMGRKTTRRDSPDAGMNALVILAFVCIYFTVAMMRYRFNHPELTETQVLLHLGDVVLWRD